MRQASYRVPRQDKKKARDVAGFLHIHALVRRGMTATLFISAASAMIAPNRVAKIQIARAGSSTDSSTTDRTDCSACGSTARCRTHQRAGAGTKQTTRQSTITRRCTAARQGQHRNRRNGDGEISQTHFCLLIRRACVDNDMRLMAFRSQSWLLCGIGIMELAMARKFTKAEAEEFFARLKKQLPEPRTELEYKNPFTLLVAVALSAQATDKSVNKATESLFKIADTPEKMAALGVQKLTPYIKTIGLYRTKAKNVIALSKALIGQHGSKVPKDREALEALPGVGRKTANVVLNVAFGEPTIAVDTHIFRVGNRTGLAPGKTPREVEDGLEKIVPGEYKLHAHHWLILHGRYTCVARKPLCPTCVVNDLCRYKDKTRELI
jgi:endonuclease-3